MPNPFFFDGHITDPIQFVGRKAELRRIASLLETAHTGQMQSVSVVGERRISESLPSTPRSCRTPMDDPSFVTRPSSDH